MIVKLTIPVVVTNQQTQENSSKSLSSLQNPWIRSYPRCSHEKENIIESWQVLQIVPMLITGHTDQIVTVCYLSNEDIIEYLVLAANCIFSVVEQGETQESDYDYFVQNYQEHVWLIVYCRKCLSVFLACGL